MSIEFTTSANNSVTCLYSASTAATSCAPHAPQNRAPSGGAAPHDRHTSLAGVPASAVDPAAPTDCVMRQGYGFLSVEWAESLDNDVCDTYVRPSATCQ
jgi:hypothetical protein